MTAEHADREGRREAARDDAVDQARTGWSTQSQQLMLVPRTAAFRKRFLSGMRQWLRTTGSILIPSSPAKAGPSSRYRCSPRPRSHGLPAVWSVPLWLVAMFIMQFFRDPPRAVPADPNAVLVAGRRPHRVGRARARPVPRARGAQDDRVHERVQRAFEPLPGRRRGARSAGTHPGAFLNAALDKASLDNERNALWLRTPSGARRDLRAGRRADRAAHPVLCRARRSASRAASASASSASARASTLPAGRRRAAGGDRRQGVRDRSVLARAASGSTDPVSASAEAGIEALLKRRSVCAAAAFTAAQSVHHRRRCSAGFYAIVQAMNGRFEHGGDRDLRGDGARRAGRARRALDPHPERVRRASTTASPTWCRSASRRRSIALRVGAARDMGTARAGSPPSSTAPCAALRLARFNTNIDVVDKRFFQGLPSPAAACLVAGLVWAMNDTRSRAQDVRWLAWGVTLFAGPHDGEQRPFYSGKDINLRKSVPFSVVVVIAFAIGIVLSFSSTLPEMLFILFTVAYAVSGYVLRLCAHLERRRSGAARTAAVRTAVDQGRAVA